MGEHSVHPVLKRLSQEPARESACFTGFVGDAGDTAVLRLHPALLPGVHLDIPRDAVDHVQLSPSGEEARVWVNSEREIRATISHTFRPHEIKQTHDRASRGAQGSGQPLVTLGGYNLVTNIVRCTNIGVALLFCEKQPTEKYPDGTWKPGSGGFMLIGAGLVCGPSTIVWGGFC